MGCSMDYNYIKDATLTVFIECNIQSFPINCFDILKHYGVSLFSYSSLSSELREYSSKYSDDAFSYKDKIFYNDDMLSGRIRFSLMHELGHKLLNHSEIQTDEMELEANNFASNLLAPRMAIHYAKCKNENDVSKLFSITHEAALYAFNDYKRWHRWTTYHKMNSYDKQLYNHFYNKEQNKFIYSIKRCIYCGAKIYNSKDEDCHKCTSQTELYSIKERSDFIVAESYWLYGGL